MGLADLAHLTQQSDISSPPFLYAHNPTEKETSTAMIPPLLLFPINPSVSKTERSYRAPPSLLPPRSLHLLLSPTLTRAPIIQKRKPTATMHPSSNFLNTSRFPNPWIHGPAPRSPLSFLSALLPSPMFVLPRTLFKLLLLHGHESLFPTTHHTSIQILALEGPAPCHDSIQRRRNVFRRPHAKNFTCACTLFVKSTTPFRPTRWASTQFLMHTFSTTPVVSHRHHVLTYLSRWTCLSKTYFVLMVSACPFIFYPSNGLVFNIWSTSYGCRNPMVELDCLFGQPCLSIDFILVIFV